MSVLYEGINASDSDVEGSDEDRLLTAEERAAIRWAAGSLVRMREVYLRMPDREDEHSNYHPIYGNIQLGDK